MNLKQNRYDLCVNHLQVIVKSDGQHTYLQKKLWNTLDPNSMQTHHFPVKVSKGAKIRNHYNQVPHLIQDTNRKVTNSQLDTTNESEQASPFPAGDHKAHINRLAQRHSKHKTEKTLKIHKRSTALVRSVIYFTGGLKPVSRHQVLYCKHYTSMYLDEYLTKLWLSAKNNLVTIPSSPKP